MSVPFRFDAAAHEYIALDTGEVLPHITGLLEAAGLVDDTWYTVEARDRGTAVHKLAADYDLGALEPAECVSPYKGYLLAYASARACLQARYDGVEVPRVHPRFRYGGRPDRDGRVLGTLRAIVEIKSGAPHRSHEVQTALQAMLVSEELRLPAEHIGRICVYVQQSGRFKVDQHRSTRDFVEAARILRRYGGTGQ